MKKKQIAAIRIIIVLLSRLSFNMISCGFIRIGGKVVRVL